eukprot:TRINITY_DN9877_c0_g1_i7.p2 TRINITY_DN9877_c0_g1~~TRINITY_DN9877_c0_g1_i7.p2  ORF type:complete len:108 (-),score=30.38 TRINITY_DN9877_c0_g1_i7:323-646(-)
MKNHGAKKATDEITVKEEVSNNDLDSSISQEHNKASFLDENNGNLSDVDDLDIVKHEVEDYDSTENLVDDPIEFVVDSGGEGLAIKDEEVKEEPVETNCDDPLQTFS